MSKSVGWRDVTFTVEQTDRVSHVAPTRLDEWLLIGRRGSEERLLAYLPAEIDVTVFDEDELADAWAARGGRRRLLLIRGHRAWFEVDPGLAVTSGYPPPPPSPHLGADVHDAEGRKVWSGVLDWQPRSDISLYSVEELFERLRAAWDGVRAEPASS